jgi:Transmembrane protein of unknown function (DUF3556)
MGFIAPAVPPVDIEQWKQQPHLGRIKPLAQDWAVNGVGAPTAVYLLYIVKLAIFVVGGAFVISVSSTGLGGLGHLANWWTDPIVFQKVVVWTMLWEFVGLGAGSMPLTFRFLPPIGGILYWLRPVCQQSLADPTRARGEVHPVWTYAHVPHGYTGDATEALLDQIERFAPGLRERILATAVRSTTELATHNANYVGGDIITGANTPLQTLIRPRVAIDPYRTGIPGVFICSAATPPGAGAHGMNGYNAAQSVLRGLAGVSSSRSASALPGAPV